MFMEKTKEKNGITLVALVITIILLLVLAGISISALIGSGLFAKAQQAAVETKYASAAEKVVLAVNTSYDTTGSLNKDMLRDNLNAIDGIYEKVTDVSYDLKVIVDRFEFTISEYGKVSGEKKEVATLPENNVNTNAGREIKIDSELEELLKKANMTITLEDIINTPAIMSEVNGLIPTITENDVIRSEEDGIIAYTSNNGEVMRSNSEYTSDSSYIWKAFDKDNATLTRSELDKAEGYYLEYEFTQRVYAVQMKYMFSNESNYEGTRVMVIQGYDEEQNKWEDLTNDFEWIGTMNNIKEDTQNLNYSKAYKRYRIYVKKATYTSVVNGAKCSALYEMQLYGIISSNVEIISEENLKRALLSNSNIDTITLNQMITNTDFTKKLINALPIETVTNHETLMANLPSLIPTITESDVIRSEEDGIIAYTSNNGEIMRSNSEYTSHSSFIWKAFDKDNATLTSSEVDKAEGYYLEYEFTQRVYAVQMKYMFSNESNYEGTRVMVIQGYDEEQNKWEDLTNDFEWIGTMNNIKEDTQNLNYSKAYKRYRIYVKKATYTSVVYGAKCSALYEMQLYGKIAN